MPAPGPWWPGDSAKLEELEPDVRRMAAGFLAACAREGILLKITQARRTYEQQAALYAQGRTAPGKIVTNAPPGYSWHNFGRAFDVAFMGSHPYDPGAPGPADDDPIWEKIGDIGEMAGLSWGGRWKRPDRPHFEDHGGMSLAMARQLHNAAEDAKA